MTTTPPLVLQINNEPRPFGPHTGFARAFTELADAGLVRYMCVVPGAGDRLPVSRPDLVFVQSPQPCRWTQRQVRRWLRVVGDPPVVVWEGDAWGGLTKPLRERNLAWMRCAEVVFTVAAGRQATMLRRACRRPVRYVPNVVPLPLLSDSPDSEPPADGVAVIGRRRTYLGIELLPDDRERTELVEELRRIPAVRLAVYGKGWRGSFARGPVPFDEQLTAMKRSLITVGWNRYRHLTGCFSNRLPIAMCAGRVHVTSRQPGLTWLPGPDLGLHLMDTPRDAAGRIRDLLDSDPADLLAQARQMTRWTRARLTDTEALQYMLAKHLPLPAPPADPWAHFAAMDADASS
ncbi:hypothetical protein ACFSL4_07360 [Streptomyces caeni]|uniref:Spore protein YkvP/CgeB glycosyl transferase-like domain-containing protein n=1 Tax=Streptomyces caeni TaxID=2307231 RepID=A0ABW4INJ7_9ACTN